MHRVTWISALALLAISSFLSFVKAYGSSGGGDERVLLEKIQVLNFRRGEYTRGRRTRGIPSMACVGGDGCSVFTPEIVQCKNQGFDGKDIAWECHAQLPNTVRFGTTDVTCEGYTSPEDPYVLAGSCGLEYTMYRTGAEAEEVVRRTTQPRQPQHQQHTEPREWGFFSGFGRKEQPQPQQPQQPQKSKRSSIWSWLGLGFVVWLFSKWARAPYHHVQQQQQPQYVYQTTGGPSAFQRASTYWDNWGGNRFVPHFGSNSAPPPSAQKTSNSRGPGFWSGATLGGLAGYWLRGRGNSGNTRPSNAEYDRARYEAYSAPQYTESRRGTPPPQQTVQQEKVVVEETTHDSVGYGGTRRR